MLLRREIVLDLPSGTKIINYTENEYSHTPNTFDLLLSDGYFDHKLYATTSNGSSTYVLKSSLKDGDIYLNSMDGYYYKHHSSGDDEKLKFWSPTYIKTILFSIGAGNESSPFNAISIDSLGVTAFQWKNQTSGELKSTSISDVINTINSLPTQEYLNYKANTARDYYIHSHSGYSTYGLVGPDNTSYPYVISMAFGKNSLALGIGTDAYNDGQVVVGKFNAFSDNTFQATNTNENVVPYNALYKQKSGVKVCSDYTGGYVYTSKTDDASDYNYYSTMNYIPGKDDSYWSSYSSLKINDDNSLFVVGNGTALNARSNAFVVYKDGTAEIQKALILSSPNGTKYKITVSDSGTLSAAKM